ncbi:MAG: N-6 DNA methylase [Pseudomonadota bacterium]
MTARLVSAYHHETSENHRKRLGQFFTDSRVAAFMVNWIRSSHQDSIYDPAFGLGAFYSAISNKSNLSFAASEIDWRILDFWNRHHRDARPVEIRQEDYLRAWGLTHANIVCNPPYMRFQNFLGRDQIFRDFEKRLGIRLSGYTNMASAFLLKSLSELKPGGRLAYIMPLEFLNAGYGTLIKKRLLDQSWIKAIIRFQCEKEVFPDATTTVGIILVDSGSPSSHVDFHRVDHMRNLDDILARMPVKRIPASSLQPGEKWLQYFQSYRLEYDAKRFVPLQYYGRFSRGIATGANNFFVGSASFFNQWGIRDDEVIACITKSCQIRKSCFSQADYAELHRADANVFLFSPNDPISAGARKYLLTGENSGYHQRFLTRNRNPWYKTEVRLPSPLLLGVFSRGGYKIIKNTSSALNLTCYHGFQPNQFGLSYVDGLFLYLLSDAGRQMLSLSMRQYGNVLDKFEPNDLNGAWVPNLEFFNLIPKQDIQEAMERVQDGGTVSQVIQNVFNDMLNSQSPASCR